MKGSPRISIVIVAIVLALGACAPAPTPSPSDAPPTDVAETVRDSSNGIGFERPTTWARWQANDMDWMAGGPFFYLSTDELRSTCAVPPDAKPNSRYGDDPCTWPLDELSPNGVLVTWVNDRILTPIPDEGEPIVLSSGPTRLQIDKPGSCKALGADETINVAIPIGQPTPISNLWVFACLRGPDLATSEAQFRALLRSMGFDAIRLG